LGGESRNQGREAGRVEADDRDQDGNAGERPGTNHVYAGRQRTRGRTDGRDRRRFDRQPAAFYDPANGSLKRKLKVDLRDVSGLAYSPKTRTLYATDFAWKTPHEGGLFALSIEGDNVKTTKIVPLDKPTALAFDPHGHLYVSVIGTANKSSGTDPGSLVYFKPGL